MSHFFLTHANTFIGLLILVVFILSSVVFFLYRRLNRLEYNHDVLFSGKTAKNLEKIILEHTHEIHSLDSEIQELYDLSNKINLLAQSSIHKAHIIKYDPFKNMSGNQSFSLALLNTERSGFVLSSLQTRDSSRFYAKAILRGTPVDSKLTSEEQRVIDAIS